MANISKNMGEIENKGELEKPEKQKKSGYGGRREGSGRKKSLVTILTGKELREQFCKLVQDTGDYQEIVANLIKHAKKDPKIGSYILEQLIGKPTQQSDVNVNGEIGLRLLEKEVKTLLNGIQPVDNTKASSEVLQDGGRITVDLDRESVQDIRNDSEENEAQNLDVSSYEVRQVLDNSVSSPDQGK